MANMRFRLLAVLLLTSAGPRLGNAQSILRTILGGGPDDLPAIAASVSDPVAVASDRNGNVYAALLGTHQVVRIDSGGTIWLVAGTGGQGSSGDGGPAKGATLSSPVGLAVDAAGNLYICDSAANRIRRVGTDGMITTFAGTGKSGGTGDGGPATAATLATPSAIAIDTHGDLLIADTLNNVVRAVTPDGIIHTIAGTGKRGSSGNGGNALRAAMWSPAGVAADNAGNIYIADTGNLWIYKLTPDGIITRCAGVDTSVSSPFGGGDPTLAVNNTLSTPTSLAVDQLGNLFVVEYGAARVLLITPDGKISSYAGTGTGGTSGDGGLARFANLNVIGIAVDAHNNLLIADGVTNRVRIVTAADGIINTLAGSGVPYFVPQGLVVNGDYLIFSDAAAHHVRQFNMKTGQVSLVAGSGAASFTGDSSSATTATLNTPRGVALDAKGNLYIADSGNNRVRKVDTSGIITTVAGDGNGYSGGDGGPATSASINGPAAVAIDPSGNLYIAERSGNLVRKVSTSGIISTVAGTGTAGAPASETGVATQQSLYIPQGVFWDPSGSLLIADSGNNRIRRLSSDGTIATVAGSANSGFSGDGGPATSASLRGPLGMAADGNGNLYIADTSNNRIRLVGPDGTISTVAGTGTGGYNGDGSPATAYWLNTPYALVPGSSCSVLIADTQNQRMRQLSPAVQYTILTSPSGLQVTFDGQLTPTPAVVSLMPGTQHVLAAPGPQNGPAGTQYVPSAAQTFTVPCGSAQASAVLNFQTQYQLTVGTDPGGSVTPTSSWQTAGTTVTLQPVAQSGFAFGGWEGDCSGTGSCKLVMNGPKNVKADFTPLLAGKPTIASGGVVGAGLSTPAVRALSPCAIATVFGSGFAPSGTQTVVGAANLVAGKVSTELNGVCVLVGSTPAPILAVTPTQVNFQVPQTISAGNIPVQVVTGCGTANEQSSDPASVTGQSAAPEFFYLTQTASGQNPIAAFNVSTGVYVGTPGTVAGITSEPASPGDILTLYATGLGLTNPPVAAGELPAAAVPVAGSVQVSIGSVTLGADVLYVGVAPSYAGLYQINIRLPSSTPDGDQPVQVTVNGFSSPAAGYITVKR